MSDSELFLHIGLHKTGTTFLQRTVFPHWPGIDYLGKPYAANHLEKWVCRSSSKVLMSNEQFSSAPVGPLLIDRPASWAAHRMRCLERVHALFPEAAILLSVRPQADLVLSLYCQCLCFGGDFEMDSFWSPEPGRQPLSGADLLFAPIIERIGTLWKRFFVFSLEEFSPVRRPALFADLAAFFGVETLPTVGNDKPLNARVTREIADELRSFVRQAPATMPRSEVRARCEALARKAKDAHTGQSDLCLPVSLRDEIERYYTDDWLWTRAVMKSRVTTG